MTSWPSWHDSTIPIHGGALQPSPPAKSGPPSPWDQGTTDCCASIGWFLLHRRNSGPHVVIHNVSPLEWTVGKVQNENYPRQWRVVATVTCYSWEPKQKMIEWFHYPLLQWLSLQKQWWQKIRGCLQHTRNNLFRWCFLGYLAFCKSKNDASRLDLSSTIFIPASCSYTYHLAYLGCGAL